MTQLERLQTFLLSPGRDPKRERKAERYIFKTCARHMKCPWCGNPRYYNLYHENGYKCARCMKEWTLMSMSKLKHTKMPYFKVLQALFILCEGDISSHKLGHRIGVTQCTAWKFINKVKKSVNKD